LKVEGIKPGSNRKIINKYKGPYYVCSRLHNGLNYVLRHCVTHRQLPKSVHCNKMRICDEMRDEFDQRKGLDSFDMISNGTSDQRSLEEVSKSVMSQQPNLDQQTSSATATVVPLSADDGQTVVTTNAPKSDEDDVWHEVERLLKVKRVGQEKHYLVKWKEGGKSTWEPAGNISDYSIRMFHVGKTQAGRTRKRKPRNN